MNVLCSNVLAGKERKVPGNVVSMSSWKHEHEWRDTGRSEVIGAVRVRERANLAEALSEKISSFDPKEFEQILKQRRMYCFLAWIDSFFSGGGAFQDIFLRNSHVQQVEGVIREQVMCEEVFSFVQEGKIFSFLFDESLPQERAASMRDRVKNTECLFRIPEGTLCYDEKVRVGYTKMFPFELQQFSEKILQKILSRVEGYILSEKNEDSVVCKDSKKDLTIHSKGNIYILHEKKMERGIC